MKKAFLAAIVAAIVGGGSVAYAQTCTTYTATASVDIVDKGPDADSLSRVSEHSAGYFGVHVVYAPWASDRLFVSGAVTFPAVAAGTVESATLTLNSRATPYCVIDGRRCTDEDRAANPLRLNVNGATSTGTFPRSRSVSYELPPDALSSDGANTIGVSLAVRDYPPEYTILQAVFSGSGFLGLPPATLEVCVSDTVEPDPVADLASAFGVDPALIRAIMALMGGLQ